MPGERFPMNAGRNPKQGQQINVGKDSPEYQAIVGTITMNVDDKNEADITVGPTGRVRTGSGDACCQCKEGNVPLGIIFVPYGQPPCRLMGQTAAGTGMPTSKGWEVQVEPVAATT